MPLVGLSPHEIRHGRVDAGQGGVSLLAGSRVYRSYLPYYWRALSMMQVKQYEPVRVRMTRACYRKYNMLGRGTGAGTMSRCQKHATQQQKNSLQRAIKAIGVAHLEADGR